MIVRCSNPDCRPGCENTRAQQLMDAMLKPMAELNKCPTCGSEMWMLSRTVF